MGRSKRVTAKFRNGMHLELDNWNKLFWVYHLTKISLYSKVTVISPNKYIAKSGDIEAVFSLDDESSIYRAFAYCALHKKLGLKVNSGNCTFKFLGKEVIYFFNPDDSSWISSLLTTFVGEDYRDLKVKGSAVADIGASYGDTVIYFALKGANKIYSYEPIPWVAEVLKKNVQYNNLSGIVEVYPNAVSSEIKQITLNIPKESTEAASIHLDEHQSFSSIVQVPILTVLPPVDAQVAKFNCEGGEYDVIMNWLKSKVYTGMVIKYHGDYGELECKLKALGYKVTVNSERRILIAN